MKILNIFLLVIMAFSFVNAKELNSKMHDKSLWQIQEGEWEFKNDVLTQVSEDDYFPLILLKNKKYSNIDVSVDFKPISGDIDASGGLVFAASNKNNYYIVRANALENNFRLYIFKNGMRYQIADSTVQIPSFNQYHNIRIKVEDKTIYAYLNHKLCITYKLKNKIIGYVGLWTKADSITSFDKLVIK